MSSESIAAVVVTFNRLERVVQCIDSLTKQSRLVNEIVVVDNAAGHRIQRILMTRFSRLGYPPTEDKLGQVGWVR